LNLSLLCALMSFFSHAAVSGSRVAISLSALAIQDSPLLVGALMAAYSLIPMLAGIPAGRLVDRLGLRTPIIASIALIAVGILAAVISRSIPMLFVAAIVIGTGSVLVSISVNNAVGILSEPAERTRNFAHYTMALSAALTVGPFLAGFAIDAAGFRGAFTVLGLCSLISLVAALHFRKLFPSQPRQREGGSTGFADLLLDPRMRVIYVITAMLNLIWDLYQFIVPLYGSRIGLSASQIGSILAAFSLATFCVRLVMPVLVRRFRDWTLIAATLAAAAIGYACLPAATGFTSLAATGVVLGAGFGFALPVLLSISYSLAPKGREGEVAGVRFALASAAHFTFPLALGALIASLGIAPMVWLVSAMLFGGTWYAGRQRGGK